MSSQNLPESFFTEIKKYKPTEYNKRELNEFLRVQYPKAKDEKQQKKKERRDFNVKG